MPTLAPSAVSWRNTPCFFSGSHISVGHSHCTARLLSLLSLSHWTLSSLWTEKLYRRVYTADKAQRGFGPLFMPQKQADRPQGIIPLPTVNTSFKTRDGHGHSHLPPILLSPALPKSFISNLRIHLPCKVWDLYCCHWPSLGFLIYLFPELENPYCFC